MWIKHISIENFQKHSRFEEDLSSGVNCIVGETDKGKSCLVRAIKWVLFNEPEGDVVRKEKTKLTKVSLILDNGDRVTRIKSAKENAYEIQQGEKVDRFDSFGKEIPEEVKRVIKTVPFEVDGEEIILNVSDQLDAPFLLKKTGGFRMKLFNKLIGSNILDLVAQDFNKDILRIGKEEKAATLSLNKGQAELVQMEADLGVKEDKSSKANEIYNSMVQLEGNYTRVADLLKRVNALTLDIEDVSKKIKVIVTPDGLPELIALAFEFQSIGDLAIKIKSNSESLTVTVDSINKMKYPQGVEGFKDLARGYEIVKPLNESLIRVKRELDSTSAKIGEIKYPDGLDDYIKVAEIFKQIESGFRVASGVQKDIVETGEACGRGSDEIKALKDKYKDMLRQHGKCPYCNSPATKELLEGIEL